MLTITGAFHAKILLYLTLSEIFLIGCARQGQDIIPKDPIKPSLPPMYEVRKMVKPEYDPIEEALKTMTLEEKVGQLVIAGFYGTDIDSVTEKS